ncbi:PilZ domain-containing protein [Oceanisphaera sp. KMM 10153]|uniref:PilZ domain-containing protein n=1 Tax=Oceanisphaera submarina TaxID=3390193 RepID=UPI003976E27D
MPNHRYLTDEELMLLHEICRQDGPDVQLSLPLIMDANIVPLLDQASALELKLELGEIKLSFPVALKHPVASQEQAELSSPSIITNGGHPRAWRLPNPQCLQLSHPGGRPLAAEIKDLSTNGMKLVSRRSLFGQRQHKKVLLKLRQDQELTLTLRLVRQHKGPQFWLTAVQFELSTADCRTLSDFVFRGFLEQMCKRQET